MPRKSSASVPVVVLPGFQGDQPDPATCLQVARSWAGGHLVGLPTETVYGLSADADQPAAVQRIYQVKGRPAGHPLIVHVSDAAALHSWGQQLQPGVLELVRAFWPGPLTVVVRRSGRAGDHITGGQDTVALRCPAHPVALGCLRALAALARDPGAGVAAPSANVFGRVSPTSAADVVAELGERLAPGDVVVDGGRCAVGLESTIIDATGDEPRLLRPGAIGITAVRAEWARAGGSSAASLASQPAPGTQVRAPGTLAAHYAPRARVLCVTADAVAGLVADGGVPAADQGLIAEVATPTPPGWVRLAAPADAVQYARDLYRALRRADDLGLTLVVAVLPDPGEPLAHAVRDRLARAAAGSGQNPAIPAKGRRPAKPGSPSSC